MDKSFFIVNNIDPQHDSRAWVERTSKKDFFEKKRACPFLSVTDEGKT